MASRDARKISYQFGSRKLHLIKPSEGYPTPDEAKEPVTAELELFYAHGYNGHSPESRQNLYLTNDGTKLVYYIAAVVIIYDFEANTQKFFIEHNDDITALCLDRREGSNLVASGQTDPIDRPGEGKDLPKVWVWNCDDLSKVELIDKVCWGFISKIQWSSKTGYIYVICGDDDQTLKVFDPETFKQDYKRIEKNKGKKVKRTMDKKKKAKQEACNYDKECLLDVSTQKEKISGFIINPAPEEKSVDELLVFGKRKFCHGLVTEGDKGKLTLKLKAVSIAKIYKAGEKSFSSATWLTDGYYAVGAQSGQIYIGKGPEVVSLIQTAHLKSVGVIHYNGNHVVSGGFDKKLVTWEVLDDLSQFAGKKGKQAGLKKVGTKDISVAGSDMVFNPKAIAYDGEKSRMFVGTKSNHIVQIEEKGDEPKVLIDGHDGQIWGLATHPKKDLYVTGGYDNVVKLWDAQSLKCIQTHEFPEEEKKQTKEVVTAAWSNNGRYLCFGTKDSNLAFFTFDDEKNAFSFQCMTNIPRKSAKAELESVSYIRFSKNSKHMAVAHMDSQLYIYTMKDDGGKVSLDAWKPLPHSAAPTHVQWSQDGKMVKTLTRDYEVCHFKLTMKTKKGKHVPNVPDPDETQWADDPLPAGWDVEGCYQPEWDGTDLNDVTITNDGKHVITGDDYGTIRLHPYPAIDQNNFKEYHGHAEFVVGVEMLRSGDQCVSCGGADMAIFQWKAKGFKSDDPDDDGEDRKEEPEPEAEAEAQPEAGDEE